MHLVGDFGILAEHRTSPAFTRTFAVAFVGGSADGRSMQWPRSVPLPTWVRTGASASDYYRVDESTGAPRYLQATLLAEQIRSRRSPVVPFEIKHTAPLICIDTIGEFPVLVREKPYRDRRFELWVQGRLVGFYPTRVAAENAGRRLVQATSVA